jgi:hypothetical protein
MIKDFKASMIVTKIRSWARHVTSSIDVMINYS